MFSAFEDSLMPESDSKKDSQSLLFDQITNNSTKIGFDPNESKKLKSYIDELGFLIENTKTIILPPDLEYLEKTPDESINAMVDRYNGLYKNIELKKCARINELNNMIRAQLKNLNDKRISDYNNNLANIQKIKENSLINIDDNKLLHDLMRMDETEYSKYGNYVRELNSAEMVQKSQLKTLNDTQFTNRLMNPRGAKLL